MVEECSGDDVSLWDPRLRLVGRRVELLIEAFLPWMYAAIHLTKLCLEFRAVYHLYKEAVRDHVYIFKMSTAMAIVLLGAYVG